ncbi:hypothetical protein ES702_04925 [subsurface metagenome]
MMRKFKEGSKEAKVEIKILEWINDGEWEASFSDVVKKTIRETIKAFK